MSRREKDESEKDAIRVRAAQPLYGSERDPKEGRRVRKGDARFSTRRWNSGIHWTGSAEIEVHLIVEMFHYVASMKIPY